MDIGAVEYSGPIESINPGSWNTVAKDDQAGFGLGWDLANTDRLVLNTDPANANAIRWVRSDGFLINFSSVGVPSADDDSASVISSLSGLLTDEAQTVPDESSAIVTQKTTGDPSSRDPI